MELRALDQSRPGLMESLRRSPETEFLVIGGGVHGAAFARNAARCGFSCVLAERSDYAGETSSRSSKMLHGGLRYLELFDFAQVAEGIRAREDLFVTAPHLCRPEPFLIPVPRGASGFRWKLALGLEIYDRMGTPPSQRHRFVGRQEALQLGYRSASASLDGAFLYTDGLTDDARLVLESVLQARQYGARCLNYLEVIGIERAGERSVVQCRDRLGGEEREIVAKRIINCAGPWVADILPAGGEALAARVRFSAGVHLLFDRLWTGPSLFLPMPGRSRYYFVWPHPGGTLVGTTEREVSEAIFDPMPKSGEVDEILERLARDLPDAGLDRSTLFHAYSGIRTLPLRGDRNGTARLSRRHRWIDADGIWTLVGGKLTTANATVWEGLRRAAVGMTNGRALRSLEGAPYPGAGDRETLEGITDALLREGLTETRVTTLMRRYGVRAGYLLEDDSRLEPLNQVISRGEVELAIREEQAETLVDILRRRTGIEYLPDRFLPTLTAVSSLLSGVWGAERVFNEKTSYRTQWAQLQETIGRSQSDDFAPL